MNFNPQAVELNNQIKDANQVVYNLLSKRGEAAFFPKLGIPSQAAQAAEMEINATAGIALEENESIMCLPSLEKNVNLPKKKVFNYAAGAGVPELRDQWKTMMLKKNPSLTGDSISRPVVTAALTNGVALAGYLFVNEGDEVIVPDLYWENYDMVLGNGWGADLKLFKTFNDKGGFNTEALNATIDSSKSEKVVIILNFPNNPSGYSPLIEEVDEIKKILVGAAENGKKILLLSDDAYFGLIYKEGVAKESIFSYLVDAHENILAVKLDGPTKEDYVWGFRIGFMTFACKKYTSDMYSALEWKLIGAIRGLISNVSMLGQSLILDAYKSESYEDEKLQKFDILKSRYEKVVEILESHPEYSEVFKPLPFNSGYFMCVEINNDLVAEEVRKQLIKKYSTGTVAIGNLIRIAYSATPEDKLETVFNNIYKAGLDLK